MSYCDNLLVLSAVKLLAGGTSTCVFVLVTVQRSVSTRTTSSVAAAGSSAAVGPARSWALPTTEADQTDLLPYSSGIFMPLGSSALRLHR